MPNVRKVERSAKSVKRRVDRRVGRTRARLGQALRKLMEQRPLEKISVQDVVELAGVSRSAFYAHYDDKVDLLLSDMDEFLERMAMLLVVRNEQSNRIAPVHEFFAHVGEAEEIRGALARSERLQDFFDLAVEHFARGIELRLRQLAEREKTQPQRPRSGSTAVASSDLVAHALAGAFIGFLNSWLRNGRPLSAKALDTMFHRFAWAGITSAGATKEVHTFRKPNWATPKGALALLAALQSKRKLSAESQTLLLKLMTESIPGAKRLKGELPAGTVVAHKTGTGGTQNGITSATNDIGIITLPDARHLAVAAFISDSA